VFGRAGARLSVPVVRPLSALSVDGPPPPAAPHAWSARCRFEPGSACPRGGRCPPGSHRRPGRRRAADGAPRLVNLGSRARSDGTLALATARYEEAASIARSLDSSFLLAVALIGPGDVARIAGDMAAAGARYRESLRLFAGPEERQGIAVCLRMLGWAAWCEGRPVAAARLYGAGDAPWPEAAAADEDEEPLRAAAVAGLREHLGEERFVALHQAGGRLSLDQAVAAGLAGADPDRRRFSSPL
jgi:hypothetical protein